MNNQILHFNDYEKKIKKLTLYFKNKDIVVLNCSNLWFERSKNFIFEKTTYN